MATEDNRTRIIATIISGVFLLASSVIGGYSIGQNNANQTNDSRNEQLSSEYDKLSSEHNELQRAYEDLQQKYNKDIINNLDSGKDKALEEMTEKYNDLLSESELLKKKILELEDAQSQSPPSSNADVTQSSTEKYLVDVLKPYFKDDFEEYANGKSFEMGGQKYYNGFTLNSYGWNGKSCAIYNLNGSYQTLTGVVGYIEGADQNWDINIIADDKLIYTLTVKPGNLPQTLPELDITGAKKLQFEIDNTDGFKTNIGFGEMKLLF